MKYIADAMRKGAAGRTQFFGDYFEDLTNQSCCAMGAIVLGTEIKNTRPSDVVENLEHAFEHIYLKTQSLVEPLTTELAKYNQVHPDSPIDLHMRSLGELIISANDEARLTIPKIAALVEQGEKAWEEETLCVAA